MNAQRQQKIEALKEQLQALHQEEFEEQERLAAGEIARLRSEHRRQLAKRERPLTYVVTLSRDDREPLTYAEVEAVFRAALDGGADVMVVVPFRADDRNPHTRRGVLVLPHVDLSL